MVLRPMIVAGLCVGVACNGSDTSSGAANKPATTSGATPTGGDGGGNGGGDGGGDGDGGDGGGGGGVVGIDPNATWNIDLENPVDEDADAAVFDVDLWDNLESGLVARLHA